MALEMESAFLRKVISYLLILLIGICLGGCGSSKDNLLIKDWKKGGNYLKIQDIYPVDGTIFPPEIAPPTIMWNGTAGTANSWYVIVEGNDGEILVQSESLAFNKWLPSSDAWEKIKSESIIKPVRIVILGYKEDEPGKLIAGSEVTVSTSKDSVGAPIFFRAVPLPFKYAVENLETISWRLGNIASGKPSEIILEKMNVCANCHSFSSDGKTFGMDVDYANDKGSYVIDKVTENVNLTTDKIITWSDFRREDGRKTYGLLSNVSPDGRFVASTVKDRSIFVPIDNLNYSQLFFPIKGIIAIYDNVNKRFYSLPGADDPEFVQSNPSWSPDGKFILFAKTKAYTSVEAEKSTKPILPTSVAKEFIDRSRRFYFDIYRIPFNDGNGGIAEKLAGASDNNMSNFFARYSPDGKWIVFCQAKDFMLLQPDSKLYILPSGGGTPRQMKCNTSEMNSWHSWSPNGKWMVFSSKQRGPYTKLYLTHIDENGNDSPPVCLEYMTPDTLAANIPEFVNMKPEEKFAIKENFMNSGFYAEARISSKANAGDFKGALNDLTAALKSDPKNYMLFYQKAIIEKKLGNYKPALEDINNCIALNKGFADAYYERANLKSELDDYKGSVEDLKLLLKLQPGNFMALYNLAVLKYNLKDFQGSINDCNKVMQINPQFGYSYFQRALNNIQLKSMASVCADLEKAINLGCPEAEQVYKNYCTSGK
jgi:hypothetical protein